MDFAALLNSHAKCTYTHTHTYTHAHMHTHTHTHAHMRTCAHAHMHTHTHAHTRECFSRLLFNTEHKALQYTSALRGVAVQKGDTVNM